MSCGVYWTLAVVSALFACAISSYLTVELWIWWRDKR